MSADWHADALRTVCAALGATRPDQARDRFVALAGRLGNNPISFTTEALVELVSLSVIS